MLPFTLTQRESAKGMRNPQIFMGLSAPWTHNTYSDGSTEGIPGKLKRKKPSIGIDDLFILESSLLNRFEEQKPYFHFEPFKLYSVESSGPPIPPCVA